ncbi:MAG: preprotein translocase subunit YajC [Acidobacteria bacterium]|nr:MAG: preprotein translocase subunit YajC [Acidobacteriota bacterium]
MRGLTTLLPLVLLMVAMYFLLFRPQQKRMAEHQRLIRSIDVGDEVVTSAGIFGKITRMTDERVELELSGGSRLEMLRSSIVRRVGDVEEEPQALDEAESSKGSGGSSGDDDEDESLE